MKDITHPHFFTGYKSSQNIWDKPCHFLPVKSFELTHMSSLDEKFLKWLKTSLGKINAFCCVLFYLAHVLSDNVGFTFGELLNFPSFFSSFYQKEWRLKNIFSAEQQREYLYFQLKAGQWHKIKSLKLTFCFCLYTSFAAQDLFQWVESPQYVRVSVREQCVGQRGGRRGGKTRREGHRGTAKHGGAHSHPSTQFHHLAHADNQQ